MNYQTLLTSLEKMNAHSGLTQLIDHRTRIFSKIIVSNTVDDQSALHTDVTQALDDGDVFIVI